MLHKKGVTKRCRLSRLTNSALLDEYTHIGGRYWCTDVHNEAQINFGDLTPKLTIIRSILPGLLKPVDNVY
jgi:hypothetical protein